MWQLVYKEGNHNSPCSGTQSPPQGACPASFHPQAEPIAPLLGPTTSFAQYNTAEVSAEPQNPSSSVSVLSERSPQTGMDGSWPAQWDQSADAPDCSRHQLPLEPSSPAEWSCMSEPRQDQLTAGLDLPSHRTERKNKLLF